MTENRIREGARKAAETFINMFNPDGWTGTGDKPDSVNDVTYERFDIDGIHDVDLWIERDKDDGRWYIVCHMEFGVVQISTDVLDSVDNLTDCICELVGI